MRLDPYGAPKSELGLAEKLRESRERPGSGYGDGVTLRVQSFPSYSEQWRAVIGPHSQSDALIRNARGEVLRGRNLTLDAVNCMFSRQ